MWILTTDLHCKYSDNYYHFMVEMLSKVSKVTQPVWGEVQFSSVAQLCPTFCDPMNRSTPGLPVYHQLPEFTQTHVHRVADAIQPSHPLSSPLLLPPIPSGIRVFPMSQLFTWGSQSTGVSALASVLPKNTQDWPLLEWTGWISLKSKDSNTT